MNKKTSKNEGPKPLEQWQIEDSARLKELFNGKKPRVSQMKFGELYEIGTQGMVWQYLNADPGGRPLNIKAAEAFARGLGVKIEDFSPTLAAQINAASHIAGAQSKNNESNEGQVHADEIIELIALYEQSSDIGRASILNIARTVAKRGIIRWAKTRND